MPKPVTKAVFASQSLRMHDVSGAGTSDLMHAALRLQDVSSAVVAIVARLKMQGVPHDVNVASQRPL